MDAHEAEREALAAGGWATLSRDERSDLIRRIAAEEPGAIEESYALTRADNTPERCTQRIDEHEAGDAAAEEQYDAQTRWMHENARMRLEDGSEIPYAKAIGKPVDEVVAEARQQRARLRAAEAEQARARLRVEHRVGLLVAGSARIQRGPDRRATARPRERRPVARRGAARAPAGEPSQPPDDAPPSRLPLASPGDVGDSGTPQLDTPVNQAWQALREHLTADWQFRHIARLCLLRARWIRRWWAA